MTFDDVVKSRRPPPPCDLIALIRLAVADARKLNRDLYVPESSDWHGGGTEYSSCPVCFAGAVIAGTLKGPRPELLGPSDFPDWWNALYSA